MLRDITFKKAYSSDLDDILNEFYIPVLSQSIEYDRLAGYFSSTSLAIAARGIANFVKNGGKMKLVVSPKFQVKDLQMIEEVIKNPTRIAEKIMLEELDKIENEFVRDHVQALGWMLSNNRLEIKVAIVIPEIYEKGQKPTIDSGIFHQKVAILSDSIGNTVTFSGSINESAMGWLGDIEEFKVFRSWESSENDYVRADINKFQRFWLDSSPKVRIISLPKAVSEKMISISPNDFESIHLEKWVIQKQKVPLFDYQKNAIQSWIKNDMKGIFEMATGTGKTYAALGCAEYVFNSPEPKLIVITCPYQHLVTQWKREIIKFGLTCDQLYLTSEDQNWRDSLTDILCNIRLGQKKRTIVITTNRTFSSNDFIQIIKNNKKDYKICLIADEVHGVGAEINSRGLLTDYDMRLGLSATPRRFLDEEGTEIIYNYFSKIVFEFSLEEAINRIRPDTGKTFLTPYRYIPEFISLTQKEIDAYTKQTREISLKFHSKMNSEEKEELLKNLYIKRANIIKNAENKYELLERILLNLPKPIKWTIIYCTPRQIDPVIRIVNRLGLRTHRFTMEEGTVPQKRFNNLSERDYILKKFAEGELDVLLAMKCLDEGVDIPPARIAILLASSGNPREYIQRIGRVIRHYENKKEAIIYDFIVAPSVSDTTLAEIEKKIFNKELKRSLYIAGIALNNSEALRKIYEQQKVLR